MQILILFVNQIFIKISCFVSLNKTMIKQIFFLLLLLINHPSQTFGIKQLYENVNQETFLTVKRILSVFGNF